MPQLISLDFIKGKKDIKNISSNYMIFYVFKGTGILRTGEDQWSFQSQDIAVMNPGDAYQVHFKDGIAAIFTIDLWELQKKTESAGKYIVCNPTLTDTTNVQMLRKLLDSFLQTQIQEQYQKLLSEKYADEIVLFLLENFSINGLGNSNEADRKMRILLWMEANYQSPISLSDTAEQFSLTKQYFERWFKAQVGETYLSYLNSIRVKHAAED